MSFIPIIKILKTPHGTKGAIEFLCMNIISIRALWSGSWEKISITFIAAAMKSCEFFKHYNQFQVNMGYDAITYECCLGAILPGGGALGGR